MKRLFVIFFITSLISCKKAAQNIAEDLIVQSMTNGKWIVTKFILNGTNITTDFSAYKFQYYSNKTVDAIKNGTVEKTGTWNGDATTMTTSANFSGAVNPLALVNGTWNITNNSWTFVEATQTNGTETKTLRLDKE